MTTTADIDVPQPDSAAGCQCLCSTAHPDARDQCLHVGQTTAAVQAARAGRVYSVRVPVCRPCADRLETPAEVPLPR